MKFVVPVVDNELAVKPVAPGLAPNTACLSNALAKNAVPEPAGLAPVATFDGSPGPKMSDGMPIVATLVLEPLICPSCKNASGSARLARTMLVKIIWSRACSDAMS